MAFLSVPFSATLDRIGDDKSKHTDIPCVLLAHNEAHILGDFFRHYRDFGDISFLVVNDCSNDHTAELLHSAPDVTVFQPTKDSTYARHKRQWRQEILDIFGANRWCLVADADERLIWNGFETHTFRKLLSDLNAEGAEALVCTMIDMYRDGPITAQIYTGQEPLEQEFPLFDDATKDPLSYRLFLAPRFFRRQWPTPQMITVGGMRDRLFFSHNRRRNALITYAFAQLGAARNPNPTGVTLVRKAIEDSIEVAEKYAART